MNEQAKQTSKQTNKQTNRQIISLGLSAYVTLTLPLPLSQLLCHKAAPQLIEIKLSEIKRQQQQH